MFAQVGASHPAGVYGLGVGTAAASPYRAASLDTQDTAYWWPSRSSADGAVLPAKDLTLARVRDVVRNDPIARAAVERLVDLIVGSGLTLAALPDGKALGIEDPKVLRAFARTIQSEWRLFANDPRRLADVQRKLSIAGLFRLLARTWIIGGEACYALMWRETLRGSASAGAAVARRYATCVMAVDPDRLSNANGAAETRTLRGGVETDGDGAPIAYHVRNAHLGDYWDEGNATWTRVPRETDFGRPVCVHGFEPEREGQTRAISPFAALISRLRMIGKFADHELAAAAANALNVAFVESNLPPDAVADRMTPAAVVSAGDRALAYFEKRPPVVGGARIPVLPPGTTIKMNAAPRQTSSFAAFETAFLQSVASSLGLSYEQLKMDWSRTNYSSARAALNEVWRGIERMRAVFVEQIVMPLFYAQLEEAIDKGHVAVPKPCRAPPSEPPLAPGVALSPVVVGAPPTAPTLDASDALDLFHAMPAAFLRSLWIGPGRGIIDPLKEAEANALELESLTTTLRHECAERGLDYEEVLDQIAAEEQDLKDRGLSRMSLVAAVQANKGPKPDSEEVTGGASEKAPA